MSALEQELALIPTLSLAELAVRWQARGIGPMPRLPLRLLQRLYAQLLQEQALGGLPASALRELRKVGAEAAIGKSSAPSPSRSVTQRSHTSSGARRSTKALMRA